MVAGLGWTAQAASNLPSSDWYAVIWNRSADTLHWVNNATELASMPRPQLPGETGEGLGFNTRFYVSPDGSYMVQIAPLENERQGIGFYDFQSGEWIQTHETQPGEFVIWAERNPFSFNSGIVALGLVSGENDWRVIAFETTTGNAIAQFDNTHPGIPADYLPANRAPSVAYVQLDEALNQWRVHVRFVQLGPSHEPVSQPALVWTLQTDGVSTSDFHPFLGDFNVLPVQGRILYSLTEGTQTSINTQVTGHESEVVYQQNGAFSSQPRWVANGQFVAFRLNQDAKVPMWYLGGVGSDNFTPFAPDYEELLGTVDGFILLDKEAGEIKFVNTLAFEAFTPTLGNVIYTTDTAAFDVVYITPIGSQFMLQSLATPATSPSTVVGDVVQAPEQTCGTAPAPRLTVGSSARVALTDGTPLNVRTAAAGNYLMQIPEGTVVNIVAGPVCADNYFWWNLQFASHGATVGGWSAEGDNSEYWLEPFNGGIPPVVDVAPPLVQPTQAPPIVAVAPPAEPTNPPRVPSLGDGDCSNAPFGAELTIGEYATVTLNAGSTLAMRANLYDPTPFYNVANGRSVNVLDGPVCNGGFRKWYVSLGTPDGPIEGWVSDGFGNNRYLRPASTGNR
jgi:hypothetical protein